MWFQISVFCLSIFISNLITFSVKFEPLTPPHRDDDGADDDGTDDAPAPSPWTDDAWGAPKVTPTPTDAEVWVDDGHVNDDADSWTAPPVAPPVEEDDYVEPAPEDDYVEPAPAPVSSGSSKSSKSPGSGGSGSSGSSKSNKSPVSVSSAGSASSSKSGKEGRGQISSANSNLAFSETANANGSAEKSMSATRRIVVSVAAAAGGAVLLL